MNTNKIVFGIVLYVMFCGQMYFSVACGSDANSTKKPAPQTPVIQQQPQRVIIQPQYIRDPSYDNRTTAIEQNQQATDQHIKNMRQDISTVDADLNTLFDQNAKHDARDTQIFQKLDRIEQLLGNINGRLKKLEERVDQQDFKLKKIAKNVKSPAPETKDPNDPNKLQAISKTN